MARTAYPFRPAGSGVPGPGVTAGGLGPAGTTTGSSTGSLTGASTGGLGAAAGTTSGAGEADQSHPGEPGQARVQSLPSKLGPEHGQHDDTADDQREAEERHANYNEPDH